MGRYGTVCGRYVDGTGTVWRKIGAAVWDGWVWYAAAVGAAGNLDALACVCCEAIKEVDSRPARSAGRVKKKLLQNP